MRLVKQSKSLTENRAIYKLPFFFKYTFFYQNNMQFYTGKSMMEMGVGKNRRP